MVHHGEVREGYLIFLHIVLLPPFYVEIHFLRNLVYINPIVIAKVVDLNFAFMKLAKVLEDICLRVSVKSLHALARESHGVDSRGNRGQIQIHSFVLIPFPVLRND